MGRILYLIWIHLKYIFLYCTSLLPFKTIKKNGLLKQYFEDCGGTFIKFGQILALRIDIIPKEYSMDLLDLFDHVKPFSYEEVEIIFKIELSIEPTQLFKVFEKTPFASASFGQVHAAKLQNGQIVAVKIQRPDIKEIINIDFVFIGVLISILGIFVKIEGLSWNEFFYEFKKWTIEELDYYKEAEHAQQIYENTRPYKHVIIPKTYHKLSTGKILVQDYIDGVPLSRILRELRIGNTSVAQFKKLGIDVNHAIKNLIYELTRQYLFDNLFHADPHPGNILVLDKGQICLLDFGICGKPSPNRTAFRNMLRSYGLVDIEKVGYYFISFAGEELEQIINNAFPAGIDNNHSDKIIKLLSKDFYKKIKKSEGKIRGDIADIKTDYLGMLLQTLTMINKYKIKLPTQMVSFLRAFSLIGFLAKECDPRFSLTQTVNDFFETHPEKTFPTHDITYRTNKRMGREEALDKLNNWLLYLSETDPNLYHLLNKYVESNQ